MRAIVDERGALRRLGFRDGRPEPSRADEIVDDEAACESAVRQLTEYFAGVRRSFDLPLAPEGTAFQRSVWNELLQIRFGEHTSYGELARRLGRPDSARAVGAANGSNPIAIVIPCHRVIGRDGSLTGYGGGLPIKRWLLDHEAGARALWT